MATIKVHGGPISTATRRVLVALFEKEVDFEFVPINMAEGEHKSEAHLLKNPFGQVPALEQGDLIMFESRAITEYIVEQFADKGTPLTSQGKPEILVWKEVEAQQFEPVASKLTWELFFKPLFGMSTDASVVAELEEKLEKVLDVYESRLGKSKFLGGYEFSLADMHHLPNLQLLLGTSLKTYFDARPHVTAWANNITARPAWAKVIAMGNKD